MARPILRHMSGVSQAVLDAVETLSKRRRSPNLFDVAVEQPGLGKGSKLTRIPWVDKGYSRSFWTIERIERGHQRGTDPDKLGRGKAWGTLTWKGVQEPRIRRINGAFKREWCVAPESWWKDQGSGE